MKFEFGNGMGRRGSILGAVALAAALAPSAATAEAPKAGRVELSAGAGAIVAVDPATGELRPPTAEEVRVLSQSTTTPVSRQSASQVVPMADGAEMANLPEGLASVTVAWVNPDGSVSQTCVDGLDAATMLTQIGGLGSAAEDR